MTSFSRKIIRDKIRALVEPLTVEERVELVDVKWSPGQGKAMLRIVIDKKGGVTIEECRTLSKRINYFLEVEDLPLGSYRLEVSSPGIFYELKNDSDFQRNIGKRVLVQLNTTLQARPITGILIEYEHGQLTIETEQGERETIPTEDIAKIRLDPLLFPKSRVNQKVRRGKQWAEK